MTPHDSPRKIDCHIHLVGDGSDGSGCFFQLGTPWKKILARMMLKEAGMPVSALKTGVDRMFRHTLLNLVERSGLDAAVLLAQDWPHDDRGQPLRDKAGFFVPNDYLLQTCKDSGGRFIPAVSIHPYRADACRELERCVKAGAKVLKLLPNCHNADCNRPDTRDFWKLMAETKTILLCHTGGEYTVPVLRRDLEDPAVLRLPLDTGVTCIAAHAAGASAPWGKDYTEKLCGLFREYPHLYTDNSATATPNRSGCTPRLLKPDAIDRVLHGSDFPVPVSAFGPWVRGQVSLKDWRETNREKNPIRRDYLVKIAMGYPESTFTRMDTLLRKD